MQQPMNRDNTPPEETRKSAGALIWILVLIALLALGWYVYNRQAGSQATADLSQQPTSSDAMTPATADSVEKESRAKRDAARKVTARTTPPAKVVPKSSEVALIGNPKPAYPVDALRAREEGTVVVTAAIDADGNPGDVSVSKRSGSRSLDRAAMKEVRGWKFKPAMENGKTIASTVQVPVNYRLDEQ